MDARRMYGILCTDWLIHKIILLYLFRPEGRLFFNRGFEGRLFGEAFIFFGCKMDMIYSNKREMENYNTYCQEKYKYILKTVLMKVSNTILETANHEGVVQ